MRDSKQQFTKTTILLHWLIAVTVICMIAAGIYMDENEVFSLYPIHKSIGVLIFIPIFIRVVWRVINGWPEPIGTYKKIEHTLAKLVHWILIIGTLLMPISGMLMSGAGGHGIAVFGLELLASNYDPVTKEAIALNGQMANIGHTIHGILGKIMIAAIALHLLGALKHHLIYKDGTLRRMLGKVQA